MTWYDSESDSYTSIDTVLYLTIRQPKAVSADSSQVEIQMPKNSGQNVNISIVM